MKNLKLRPYTTYEIKPTGWMKRQLEIQAEGLSGNLHKIWPDIRDSKWIGGTADGWERVPYWLDGFIPLAYLLDREDLKADAKKYVDAIISFQCEDGWICPCTLAERPKYDVWAVFLISKVLYTYYQCSKDERIPGVVENLLKNLNAFINHYPLMRYWGRTRWYETLLAIYWLRERNEEDWQLELAHKLAGQSFTFKDFMDQWKFNEFKRSEHKNANVHVVNVAMSLKGPALYSRITSTDLTSLSYDMLETLDNYHGMPTGHFTGDEYLGNTSPIRGSECCSVTEFMFSLENLISLTGDMAWSDRLERVAYNALPATLSPDMWTHQYDQMTNQVACTRFDKGEQPFTTNPEDSHLFGLEPNFGCCTANFNQGFPKLALSAFMASNTGVTVTCLMPALLNTQIDGVAVTIESITDYPFQDQITYKITTEEAVAFDFTLKIPGYVSGAVLDGETLKPNQYITINRTFQGETTLSLELLQDVELLHRPSGMVCVKRGALTYALPIQEQWNKIEYKKDGVERKYPYCDYEIIPRSKWNYSLADDTFQVHHHGVSDIPFSNTNPALSITAKLQEIQWDFADGKPEAIPRANKILSEPVELELIPYGATNLRLTELPYLPR